MRESHAELPCYTRGAQRARVAPRLLGTGSSARNKGSRITQASCQGQVVDEGIGSQDQVGETMATVWGLIIDKDF